MILLQWSWTLKTGPWVRASVGSRPLVLVLLPLAGAAAAVLGRNLAATTRAAAVVVVVLLVAALVLSSISRELRRRQRLTRARVQSYVLTEVALELGLGQDRYSLPLAELSVVRAGLDWLALRRRGVGGRPLLLLFDDASLAPQAAAIIAERGAGVRD